MWGTIPIQFCREHYTLCVGSRVGYCTITKATTKNRVIANSEPSKKNKILFWGIVLCHTRACLASDECMWIDQNLENCSRPKKKRKEARLHGVPAVIKPSLRDRATTNTQKQELHSLIISDMDHASNKQDIYIIFFIEAVFSLACSR